MIGAAEKVYSSANSKIWIRKVPGHFAMTNSHANYYVDILEAKLNQSMAQEAASVLAANYTYNKVIDAIFCMDGCEVIGAFLAQELSRNEMFSVNGQENIYVVTPENEKSRQMILRDNVQPMVRDKCVLILAGSVLTGKNVRKAMECLNYYGARPAGIAAVFSIVNQVAGLPLISLFSQSDIPDYCATENYDCPACRAGEKIDALANCYGYSVL